MFKKFLQGSSTAETVFAAPAEELNGSYTGLSVPGARERNQTASPATAKLSSFDEIYHKTAFKAATSTAAWDILILHLRTVGTSGATGVVYADDVTAATTPEPASLGLVAVGAAGLLRRRRRV